MLDQLRTNALPLVLRVNRHAIQPATMTIVTSEHCADDRIVHQGHKKQTVVPSSISSFLSIARPG